MEITLVSSLALIFEQVVLIYLISDLCSGLFHWAEDTLGADDTPIWGPLFAAPNSKHHSEPTAMLKIHWARNNFLPVAASILLVCAFRLFNALTWQIAVFATIAGFSQQAHRFSHTLRARLPMTVVLLQRIHVLQDARHHWEHHRPPHLTRYCALTPWLNPVLDRIRFWRVLDRVFVPVFGAPRRLDLCDEPWYRDRAIWA
ncbi:fatty acid desaturase family protein [Cognatishimia sp. F0-27]|uniref:fatty acid desaturase family protein n=1 Tax=Cognatishimia sp. F0-27 TaxID=2816855 RepID=UPI001D0CB257|nr:hypothetical protein [Cognatishimia sp. F0-27]